MKLKYLWVGLATFALFAIVFAPASIVTGQLQRLPGATATGTSGTLWSGSTNVIISGARVGTVEWRLAPTEALRGRVGFDVELTESTHFIEGRLSSSVSAVEGNFAGRVSALAIDDLLRRYDIVLPGEFVIDDLKAHLTHGARLPMLNGEVHWSGGAVRWRMSGRNFAKSLPPLVAFVDSTTGTPKMTVYQPDDNTPLLLLSAETTGWVTIGVTKRFTELVDQPWAGNEPGHGVVLEVQEKLF